MRVAKYAYLCGTILMLLAVSLGAFGAHAFKQQLVANGHLDTFGTANDYHFYQALGLLLVGLLSERSPPLDFIRLIVMLMVGGVLIFSGSLYCLALLNIAWLGAITPFGGLCMLLAWSLLLVSLWRTP